MAVNKILKISLPLMIASIVLGAFMALSAIPAEAQTIKQELCKGSGSLGVTGGSGNCETNTQTSRLNNLITNVINIFSIVVGIAAVIMIIWGGFRYITSAGDSSNITAAKNTIIYALVGLVIVALAQVIVRYVVGKAAGSNTGTPS